MTWQEKAVCPSIDPHIFYPETAEEAAAAKRVCFSCDVREQCLRYALENDEWHGIWGGKTVSQRKSILRNAEAESQALQQKQTA